MRRPRALPLSSVLAIAAIWLGVPGVFGAQTPVPVRVMSITSGPAGQVVNGNFVFRSERSVFNRSDDREVIVLFQWDYVPGPHKLTVQWRSPDGSGTANAAADYVATGTRFGSYWTFPISPSMIPGTWSVEAFIDGLPAGRLAFEIADEKVPDVVKQRALTTAEIYSRLDELFVVFRRSAFGKALEAMAGLNAGSRVYTSVSTLDNTDEIRVVGKDGQQRAVSEVIGLDRRSHLAAVPGLVGSQLLAGAQTSVVGTRCFSMAGTAADHVLLECSITGQRRQGTRQVALATFLSGRGVTGAPVISEFGDVLGILGDVEPLSQSDTSGIPVIPLSQLDVAPGSGPFTLTALRLDGSLLRPLAGQDHILAGGFAEVDAKGKIKAFEHRREFPVRTTSFGVFVVWNPKDRVRGQLKVQIWDAENHIVGESKPTKIDFRKGQSVTSSFAFSTPRVPGLYRVELVLDAASMWRETLELTP